MNAEKIAELQKLWAYMVLNGVLTTGEYSYYGGEWEPVKSSNEFTKEKDAQKLIKLIQTFDVDWAKTALPEFGTYSDFTDSESPSLKVDTLKGTLVLNNAQEYTIGVRHPEKEYVKLVEKLNREPAVDNTARVFGSRAAKP